ncbi:hypothetical protein [Bacillus weihaiensis]|uniref:hypothetical protein n=1 Tax=Bacillus weihaiensis TaxID=1547283 RepID=UPI0023549697|nr:hypothetical protein [Bacillus weihaiensis]
MSNQFDEKVTKELVNRTHSSNENMKEEVWAEIEKELFTQRSQKKKKKRIFPYVLATAASILLVVGLRSEPGYAIIDQIKELFEPEKEIIQNIEGEEEETPLSLKKGVESDYVIYVDEERYTFVQGDNFDKIITKEPLPEMYPEVSMEIRQIIDREPAEVVNELKGQLQEEFPELSGPEEISEPVNGFKLHGVNGSEWDSPVLTTYVISNGHTGSYVITERYFLEAAEGHGVRFDEMVKEFHVVKEVE